MAEENVYKVIKTTRGNLIRMPETASGYYERVNGDEYARANEDAGIISFIPINSRNKKKEAFVRMSFNTYLTVMGYADFKENPMPLHPDDTNPEINDKFILETFDDAVNKLWRAAKSRGKKKEPEKE